MRTFYVQTLGCKVNQYEGEQIAAFLRSRGLTEVAGASEADLRVIHTCAVTSAAAAKSGQTARRATRLPVLPPTGAPVAATMLPTGPGRTVITGCWATAEAERAAAVPGVSAVVPNDRDLAGELAALLDRWTEPPPRPGSADNVSTSDPLPAFTRSCPPARGTVGLPLLGDQRAGHQRAYLKVQDGCDAWCTYCIIPRLRPAPWSKPIEACVVEARRLVWAGHREIVLTGIFLGAYGHATALRRRQVPAPGDGPLAGLVAALCTQVPGLKRLRLSSLEPGDLTPGLLGILRSHPQVTPHFHLPLQSGSDAILRRMNRQYRRDDYLRMADTVRAEFDRPAVTTDIVVGFPGETEADFELTMEIVERVGFAGVHAFTYSPRAGTAAARWAGQAVPGRVTAARLDRLIAQAKELGQAFRRQFVGETVEVLVERFGPNAGSARHGRCPRHIDVRFSGLASRPGDAVRVTIDAITPDGATGRPAE